MAKRFITLLLLLAACGDPPQPKWGTVIEVDKDHKIVLSSLWHYTVQMDDGRVISGRAKTIIKKGWRMSFLNGGVVEIREPTKEEKLQQIEKELDAWEKNVNQRMDAIEKRLRKK